MQHGDTIPSTGPASTTASGPLTRILMVWTAVLTVLVIAGAGTLPPTLVGLLLPYLALSAWHVLSTNGPRRAQTPPTSTESASGMRACPDPQAVGCTLPEALSEGPVSSETGVPSIAAVDTSASSPVETREVRGRRRARPTPSQEPAPASWIQVAPGRFIRGEEPESAPDAPHDVPAEHATDAVPAGEEASHEAMPMKDSQQLGAGEKPDDPPGGPTGIEAEQGEATTDLMIRPSGRPSL